MKRYIVCIVLLSLILSLFSCAAGPDNDTTSFIRSDTYAIWGNWVFGGNKYFDMNTGELSYVCGDPLCSHNDEKCPAYGLVSADFRVIPNGTENKAPVIYYNTQLNRIENGTLIKEYRFEQYDMAANTRKQLCQTESVITTNWAYDGEENAIYYTQWVDDGNVGTTNAYCKLDINSGRSTTIATSKLLNPITAKSGTTLYLSSSVDNLIYTIDLTEKQSEPKPTDLHGVVCGKYLYYTETTNTYTVTPPPELDLTKLSDPSNASYSRSVEDVYRVPLNTPYDTPELVVSGICGNDGYRISGKYMYAQICAPAYIGSYYTTNKKGQVYDLDEAGIPENVYLINIYSTSSGVFSVTELDTLKSKTVTIEEIDMSAPIMITDNAILGSGSTYNKKYIMNYVHDNELNGRSFIYGTWYITYDENGKLRQEDSVRIDWNKN